MPNINWGNVEAKEEGAREQLPAGAYVCAIMDVEQNDAKEYTVLTFDIMEGPKAEFFKNSQYPPRMWLSWKPSALGMLKGRLEKIQADNPGFDAMAAFNNNAQLFVAKKCGVVFRAEEYVDKRTGEVKMGSPRPDRIVPVSDVRAGKVKAPDPKTLSDEDVARLGGYRAGGAAATAASDDLSDVPFI